MDPDKKVHYDLLGLILLELDLDRFNRILIKIKNLLDF